MDKHKHKFNVINEKTPLNIQLSARFEKSLANRSIRYWLIGVLTELIGHLSRSRAKIVNETCEKAIEEINATVIVGITQLINELQTDEELKPINDATSDSRMWNECLATIETDKRSYFSAPWLFVECYVYRRLNLIFGETTLLREYDYFKDQKNHTLSSTLPSIKAIASYLVAPPQVDKHEMLLKLLKLNLWGNRVDLCTTAGQEIRINDDPFVKILELESAVLADDSEKVWIALQNGVQNVEFINDNAGYELFVDLILADFMLDHNLTKKVTFNLKAIPWFLSDALEHDFHYIINFFLTSNHDALIRLGTKWQAKLNNKEFVIHAPDNFWTTGYEYAKMQTVDPNLYNRLSKADLLIFKGDLNYRKLLGDLNWDPTTLFKTSLNGFLPTKLVSLRTVKSDVISGLEPGVAERITAIDADWMVAGDFGVIQFAE